MSGTEWRYGIRIPGRATLASSSRGFSPEGCINMLGHNMASFHHSSGACTCGQYRKDRLKRHVDEHKWCQPCKDLEAARQALHTRQEVTYLGRVFSYHEEPSTP